MTPRLLHALLMRWVEAQQREDRRAALMAMTIANVFRGKNTRVLTLDDFMVHRFGASHGAEDESSHEHRQTQSPEEQVAFARALTLAMGGKDLTSQGS